MNKHKELAIRILVRVTARFAQQNEGNTDERLDKFWYSKIGTLPAKIVHNDPTDFAEILLKDKASLRRATEYRHVDGPIYELV
jgi:hypothetical protein